MESPPVEPASSYLRRSLSAYHETESPAPPVLTYRPKPAFGADRTCAGALSASSSIMSSAPASNQSTVSSPLSSTCGKSSGSSPTMTWSSPKTSVAAGGGDNRDTHSFFVNYKMGLSRKSTSNGGAVEPKDGDVDRVASWSHFLHPRKCASHGGAVEPKDGDVDQVASWSHFLHPRKCTSHGGAVEPKDGDVQRAASWSHYLDSSGESYYEAVEKRHKVELSELFLGQRFACGGLSRLYRGQYHDQEVAVKILREPEDGEVAKKLVRQFHQEVYLLSRLHHANIVQFVGATKEPPVFCIITEYLAGGSLRAFLHKNQPNTLPMDMVLALALDVARGMEYLHSQGVLHLDLKSENLLLADSNRVKVTDFGVSRSQSECESMTPDPGTYKWMAPEMISNKTFSKKADVYSFGIVLWEIITGETPYQDMNCVQAAFAVVDKYERPRVPDSCPHPLKQLMEECWAANPDKRPSYYEIVQRLEQFQDCLRRNEALRYCSRRCEKPHWFQPWLQKFLAQSCVAHKQMTWND